MSEVRELSDFISKLPVASTLEGKKLLLADGGDIQCVNPTCFAMQVSASVQSGKVVKVSNITSALIAVRRTQNVEAALIWVSSYTAGGSSRTVAKAIYSHTNYAWFINGASDGRAAVYLSCATTASQKVVAPLFSVSYR